MPNSDLTISDFIDNQLTSFKSDPYLPIYIYIYRYRIFMHLIESINVAEFQQSTLICKLIVPCLHLFTL